MQRWECLLTQDIIAYPLENSNDSAKEFAFSHERMYNEFMEKGIRRVLPILSVLLSGILWGVISLFIRELSAAGLSAMQICFVRLLFAAPIFVIVALAFSPAHLRIRLRDIWIFLGTGVVSVVLFNYFYFYTIIHSEASVAVVLLYTSPIFVMLLSALIFKEKVGAEKILALAMTFIGCILVSGVTSGGASLSPLVAFVGVMSGLFYALYTIFGTFGLRRYDPLTVTAYTFLFAFLASLPISDLQGVFAILSATPSLWLWCAGIAVISTVLPYFFYTWGLRSVEPSRAAILVAVEPIVGCLLGMIAYGERHDFPKILGILFVVGAILLLNAPKRSGRRGEGIQPPAKK